MPSFRIADLPDKTKTMHQTEARWRKKNWNDSLKNHGNDLEELLSLIQLFDVWKNRLPRNNEAIKCLSREIYTDGYMSIHLACFGLYKSSYMSLRSQFETAMRLIYFATHPLEFKLWIGGDEKWIGGLLKGRDVWGESFKYFVFIPEIAQLEASPNNNLWLTKGDSPKLRETHSKLSKYVHSGGPFLQTRSGRLSPKYNQDEFTSWCKMFKDVQMYINILFALCFSDQFRKMPSHERDQIMNLAIGADYRDIVKQVCGL
jgi:hypothetical protein